MWLLGRRRDGFGLGLNERKMSGAQRERVGLAEGGRGERWIRRRKGRRKGSPDDHITGKVVVFSCVFINAGMLCSIHFVVFQHSS